METEYPITQSIRNIIKVIGDDPDREGLVDTPERIVKSWKTIYGGYKEKPDKVLATFFEDPMDSDEQVILSNINFCSMCEHHMLPFFGRIDIGYIPNEIIVGVSKLARVVEVFSRRLQIQERLTKQIADSINEVLNPKGVAVKVEAQHFCITSRGVKQKDARMITTCFTGVYRTKQTKKEDFLTLL